MSELVERIGDRTHGATLSECEQWAEEIRLKNVYIAQLEDHRDQLLIDNMEIAQENAKLRRETVELAMKVRKRGILQTSTQIANELDALLTEQEQSDE